MSIRYANKEDIDAIAAIHVVSWQKIYRGHIPDNVLNNLSIKERKEQWNELIEKGLKILVIEKNNIIVGFASICPARDPDMNQQVCVEISAIYLHPSVWRQGLGKKLCYAALAELKNMTFKEVIIWVLQANTQARNFYSALGFEETGNTKSAIYAEKIILNEVRYKKFL